MKRVVLYICLCLLLVPTFASAKTLQEYYDQLESLEAQYNANKNKKSMTQSELNTINNEITTINNNITQIRKDIEQAEVDIKQSEKDIEQKKTETDGFLQFLQVTNGGSSYLEYIFDAESYTELIYRYEVVKQLTNYNSELIDDLEALIKKLEQQKKDLAQKEKDLEARRKELTAKVSTLSVTLASYQTEGTKIEDDIKDLRKEIKAYESYGCKKEQDVSQCTAMLNASGWRYPIYKGCVTSEYTGFKIRTDWSGGGGHHGIDLSCIAEGTSVYPTADGKIARIIYKSTCGGNQIYVYHTINGKKYTTAYLHLLSISSDIYVGKLVTDNTVIGKVGGGSTSTKKGGYDRCTTGTHLHFGIAEGWNANSFSSYSINPREKLAFPKLIYNGGGYFYR